MNFKNASVYTVCPQCHKTFSYFKSNPRKHCSRACASAATLITTNCLHCGKSFTRIRSRSQKYYCGLLCRSLANLGIKPLGKMFCEICGNEITRSKFHGAKFCSQKCFGIHVANTKTGVPRPDQRGAKPHLQKRVAKECPICKKVFQVKQSHAERRRCCSNKCMGQWRSDSGIVSGEKNFNWKGGYSPYYGKNWYKQRRAALNRDNHTCQRCHKTEQETGRELDVHHIKRFGDFGVERYREANHLDNLISLCNVCHLIVEHEQGTRPNPR